MSLINEALKRTRDATVQKTMAGQPDMSQYKLDHHPVLPSRKQTRWLVIGAVGLVLLGGVSFAAWKFLQPKPKPIMVATPAPPPPSVNLSDPVLMEKLVERMKPKPEPVPPPTPPAEVPVVAPVEPPKFTLEGITRDSEGFEALVNGASVRQGEEIDGAKVTVIDSHGVRLRWQNQEIVLRMR